MDIKIENPNPIIKSTVETDFTDNRRLEQELDEEVADEFDAHEIFNLVRHINDPEHPLSLE